VYLDDIIIASQTFDEHLRHLTEIFRRLREARLRLNLEKCHFCRSQLRYLGHVVDRRGIRPDKSQRYSSMANAYDRAQGVTIFGNSILVLPVCLRLLYDCRPTHTSHKKTR